ncbi:hypothetical protein BLX41_14470 [Pseudomonas protegens]|uniref:hypothetical protein n=1 Tax=Pseudomonas protegens TaxID=380021 RepID=UPI000FF67BAB|nr:hypothetical protein [Pseudomonas protegens]ROL76555.1 hypothetical protein BLX41_14470 [Pseudomonas protegens]
MTLFTMLHRLFVMRRSTRADCARWLGTALTLVASSTFAADCEMRLSNPEVDYGTLNRSDMDIRGSVPIALGNRQLNLTVVCREETRFGLRFEGQAADLNSYRFADKGHFTITLSNATLDGNTVQLAQAGSARPLSPTELLRPNQVVTTMVQGQRAVGKVFLAQVEIQTYISDTETYARDITVLEGLGRLTLDTQ